MHEIIADIARRTDWTQVLQALFVMLPLLAAQITHMMLAWSADRRAQLARRDSAEKLEEVHQIVNGGGQK